MNSEIHQQQFGENDVGEVGELDFETDLSSFSNATLGDTMLMTLPHEEPQNFILDNNSFFAWDALPPLTDLNDLTTLPFPEFNSDNCFEEPFPSISGLENNFPESIGDTLERAPNQFPCPTAPIITIPLILSYWARKDPGHSSVLIQEAISTRCLPVQKN